MRAGGEQVPGGGQAQSVTPANAAGEPVESTPAERFAALLATGRRRWRVALLVFALTVGTTLFLTLRGPSDYAASAQILLQPSDAVTQALSPGVVPSPADAQRDIDTNTRLITSTPVLEAVRRQLRLAISNRELKSKLSVSGQESSNLVSIKAQDQSARQAARIATAVAMEYDSYRRSAARAAISQSIADGRSRLLALKRTGGSAAERRALQQRLIQLQTSAAVGVDGAQVIRRATPPVAPTAPSKLIPIASVLIGVMLAIGAALAYELLDKRLLQQEDAESAFGVPVLLGVPGSGIGGADDVEAYAGLAARLAVGGLGDRAQVLMISSVGPRDLSSKVATGLASQLAALDLCVVQIEANLGPGGPESTGLFAPPNGLSAVLQGLASFDDELLPRSRVDTGAAVNDLAEVTGWTVLPAGTSTATPGVLLGRAELASTIDRARVNADFVVVEAPATEKNEVFPVAALSDGILLVAEAPSTTRDHANRVQHALGPLYEKVRGLVLCAAAPSRTGPHLRRAWPRRRSDSAALAKRSQEAFAIAKRSQKAFASTALGDDGHERDDSASQANARSAG
jgi:capsular polysaccharide biosynthesis protein